MSSSSPAHEYFTEVVGRAQEQQVVVDALSGLPQGVGGAVFIEGEPGIGKSRLLQETIAWAERSGIQVFIGRCEELEQARPFGPLLDALDCHPAAPEARRCTIGKMVYPDGGAAHQTSPASSFHVIEAFIDLIEEMVIAGPMLIAVEDLHWSDPSTLVTLRAINRRLADNAVGIVATLRPNPRIHELEVLIEKARDQGALWLPLAPLSDDFVVELARAILDKTPGPRLSKLLDGASGNPLFITELIRSLDEDSAIDLEGAAAEVLVDSLPPTLRLTILRRSSMLPSEAVDMLRIASVLGSSFSVSELAALMKRTPTELLPAIDQAMAAGILTEAGPDIRFRHDLLREVIYQDLPRSVRSGLHREAARTLSEIGVAPVKVATHFSMAAEPGDEEAISWLQRAAFQVQEHSPNVSADLLEKTIEIMDPSDDRRDAVLAELIFQLLWSGRVEASEKLARSILDRPHDPRTDGALRLSLGRALMILGLPDDALRICYGSEEIELQDFERVQLMSDSALAFIERADLAEAEMRANEAIQMDPGEHSLVARTTLSQVVMFRGELDRSIELADMVFAGVSASKTYIARLPARYFKALTLLYADRFDEAAEEIRLGRQTFQEQGNLWALPLIEWAAAVHRFLAGEWDDAVAFAESGLTLNADVGVGHGRGYASAVLSMIAAGRWDAEAARHHAQISSSDPVICWFREWPQLAIATEQEVSGDPASLSSLQEAWRLCIEPGLVAEYPTVGPRLAISYLEQGRTDDAAEIASALKKAAAVMGTPSAEGASLLIQGLIVGDKGVLNDAVEAWRRSPRLIERARAFEEAGLALGHMGDAEGADLIRSAIELYSEVGAAHHIGRASSKLRTLGIRVGTRGRRGRPTTGWDSLTPTESQVVKLVADGLTNRAIANLLFISPRTVETHVSHCFQKLGMSSRTELIAAALRREADRAQEPSLG